MKFKDIIIFLRPHIWLGWLSRFLFTAHNTIELSRFINGGIQFKKRNYNKRYKLYHDIVSKYELKEIDYLEFGVGVSMEWWRRRVFGTFYGFDTFQGIPEKWGKYDKGSMIQNIPSNTFIYKGLFQDTLYVFFQTYNSSRRKVIHLDADLFSSTLFVLTFISPYLDKGDILIFDEFNCPNHEWMAFKAWCDSYYIKPKMIAQVNNFHQVAFEI
jgi:hypothetical protein